MKWTGETNYKNVLCAFANSILEIETNVWSGVCKWNAQNLQRKRNCLTCLTKHWVQIYQLSLCLKKEYAILVFCFAIWGERCSRFPLILTACITSINYHVLCDTNGLRESQVHQINIWKKQSNGLSTGIISHFSLPPSEVFCTKPFLWD